MRVDQSNWAISGGIYSSSSNGGCIVATPSGTYNIAFVAVINAVCDTATNGGFSSVPYFASTGFGVDEFAVVGSIAYNTASGSTECFSGLTAYDPKNVNSLAGTHVFFAGNLSYANIDGCATHTDGEGLILDDWSNSQSSGIAYTGQGAVQQNLFIGNGGFGLEVFNNTGATVHVKSTTTWGNLQDPSLITSPVASYGELFYNANSATTVTTGSIFQSSEQTLEGRPVYGAYLYGADLVSGSVIDNNYIFGVAGNNTHIDNGAGFAFGAGNVLSSPGLASPSIPGAPPCSASATAVGCMSATFANFAPSGGAAALGYQPPGPCTADADFPTWLAGVLPVGLITQPCGTN